MLSSNNWIKIKQQCLKLICHNLMKTERMEIFSNMLIEEFKIHCQFIRYMSKWGRRGKEKIIVILSSVFIFV